MKIRKLMLYHLNMFTILEKNKSIELYPSSMVIF